MSELSTGDIYNLAAAGFDLPQMGFVAQANQWLIERAQLQPGQRVLDVGCGTGSSALLAAQRVAQAGTVPVPGAAGTVIGVDVAERMIEHARRKAADRNVANAFFEIADLMTWTPPVAFDVVLGGFSLFHLPDPPAGLEKIASCTRRPGRWAFTFWGVGYLQELKQMLRADVATLVPEYEALPSRMERYNTPEKIEQFLSGPGRELHIATEVLRWPFAGEEDWWLIACNSGERRTIEAVPVEQRETLRMRHLERVRQRYPDAFTVDFTVHFAIVDLR